MNKDTSQHHQLFISEKRLRNIELPLYYGEILVRFFMFDFAYCCLLWHEIQYKNKIRNKLFICKNSFSQIQSRYSNQSCIKQYVHLK